MISEKNLGSFQKLFRQFSEIIENVFINLSTIYEKFNKTVELTSTVYLRYDLQGFPLLPW